ncbi:hypothetical protein L596_028859 [Steinernema carpocapsae]|uniref:Uncharacterized protein n=1 Tax=Steinernema carpocapsae TaxID=34508 RepID=A0A4U5LZM3_STECR|nr:hypothetical protein L596_028859 [Steinernema carpocapsae]
MSNVGQRLQRKFEGSRNSNWPERDESPEVDERRSNHASDSRSNDGRRSNAEFNQEEWGAASVGDEWSQIPDRVLNGGARQNASWNSGPPQGPRRYDAPSRDNRPPPPGGPPQNYSGYDNGPNRRPNGPDSLATSTAAI